jgi:hypothetical protein
MPERTRRKRRNRHKTKDRVLQARIPEQLDEELRSRAEQLGLSVSTIVRNVLLHTFDLVEGVVTDSSQIARALTGWDATPSGPDANPTVIGWQEAILNRNGVCEQCNAILPLGQRAAIGVPTGSHATLLCLECLSALSSSTDDPPKPPAPKKARKRPSGSTSAGLKKTAE